MVRLTAPIAALFAVLGLAACSANGAAQEAPVAPPETQAAAVHPESGLELIDVTVLSGDKRHVFVTEVAASNAAQQRGMMFRTQMGDDEGMIFPSYVPQMRSFWMKNTPLPLDIIFIGEDNRIINIGDGVPYSTASVASDGPAIAVFEIRGGLSAELGIKPGDLVEWKLPEGAAP
ncbi:hypothetical protein MACH24_08770 [Erythrobacter sp. Dej080120_24]|jgi:uncharacterized membrane protein (UPF0127 family)|uniref:DUF192 domain-containing protein n=1 Tax=Erythrobacter sp. Dej080120_24 TaxID=3024837 RepID=UPI0029229783|nr:hypothetical protein MACH24_08770 [Erythrobacter sp. Dej080120_24]